MALIIWGSSGVISCIRLAWEVFRNLPSTKLFRVGYCLRAGALHDIKSTWWRLMKWSMKAHNPQWRNVIPNEELELCCSSNGLPFVRASRINCIVRSLQLEDVYIPKALQKDMDWRWSCSKKCAFLNNNLWHSKLAEMFYFCWSAAACHEKAHNTSLLLPGSSHVNNKLCVSGLWDANSPSSWSWLSQKTFWNFVMPDFAGFLYLKSPKRSETWCKDKHLLDASRLLLLVYMP